MARLPAVHCPTCKRWLESDEFTPNARGGAYRASGYESCLRRCQACGIGLSNANTDDLERLTVIYRDPFAGLQAWVKEGWDETLEQALNANHRPAKRTEFASSNSEDHVTWTVFRFLQNAGALGQTLRRVGIGADAGEAGEPLLLLWGVPLPSGDPSAAAIRDRLIGVLDHIGEHPRSRSEPDVILNFGRAGVVLIEVKRGSANDTKPAAYAGWDKYLKDTPAFRDAGRARQIGLYELARNWRIGWDLAGGRPLTLVNLGPAGLFEGQPGADLLQFRECLNRAGGQQFEAVTWGTLLGAVEDKPDWFAAYVCQRGLA
jgi:hypothetical protein